MKKFKLAGLFLIFLFITACDAIENSEGDQATLCTDYFQQCVNPLYNTPMPSGTTCANAGCHAFGGSGGSFHVEPTGNIDSFNSTFSLVDLFDVDNSLLLRRPLDATHTGGQFPNLAPGTVCYNQIRAWMDVIVTEKPDPPACAALPGCVVADASGCT